MGLIMFGQSLNQFLNARDNKCGQASFCSAHIRAWLLLLIRNHFFFGILGSDERHLVPEFVQMNYSIFCVVSWVHLLETTLPDRTQWGPRVAYEQS